MRGFKVLLPTALIGIASTVSAAEIWDHAFPTTGKLKWNGFDSGYTAVDVNGPSVTYNGQGGQFNGYFYTDGSQSADEFFRFFCIDLYQYANAGPNDYTASLYANSALARLFDIAYPNESAGDFYNGSAATNFGQFASNVYSSAFQLAVWEISYETSTTYDLTRGTFNSNITGNGVGTPGQQAVAQAATWLNSINAGGGSESGWALYKFTSSSKQDYLSAIYRPNTVPEPGTLTLLGLGLFGLVASRRRKQVTGNYAEFFRRASISCSGERSGLAA